MEKSNQYIQIEVFKIRMNSRLMKKDTVRLNEFLKDKDVTKSYTEMVKTDIPYWSMIIHYKI